MLLSTKAQDVLDLPSECEWPEIQRRYRELARIEHPDQGGNQEQWRIINTVYSQLRREYRHGGIDPWEVGAILPDQDFSEESSTSAEPRAETLLQAPRVRIINQGAQQGHKKEKRPINGIFTSGDKPSLLKRLLGR